MFDILAPWYDKFRKMIEYGEVKEIDREIRTIEKNCQKSLKVLDVGGWTGTDIAIDSLSATYPGERNR